jgi:hypothetical protein
MGNGSLLSEVQGIFVDNGWNLRDLDFIRMEYVPGNGGDESGGNSQTQQDQGQNTGDSLAGDFLKNVDPAHKIILEPYVKQWDAGVTKKFQDLHSQYAPYKDLGDPETLQQAIGLYQALNSDPQAFFEAMQEAFDEGQAGEQGTGIVDGELPEEFQGLPPAFVEQFQQMAKVQEALAEF